MCIAIPGQIVEIIDAEKHIGRVAVAGQVRTIHLGLLEPEEAQIGSWVLMNANLALRSVEADEAAFLLQLVNDVEQSYEEEYS